VSLNSAGEEGKANSYRPSISADGRFVAFESNASNLVAGDNNSVLDIFVFDRQTRGIERVSVSSAGAEGNGDSKFPSISADGRFVAFYSRASSLAPGSNALVFVFDRQTRAIEVVEGGSDDPPSISADGQFVAFSSSASNLVPGDTNNSHDVFVLDRQTRAVERVSVSTTRIEGNSLSNRPSISADGQFVSFYSNASNLVSGDTNDKSDVFVFDRQTRAVERVSLSNAGAEGNGNSSFSSISADGRYVAFDTSATNLIDGEFRNGIYVFDRQTRVLDLKQAYREGLGGSNCAGGGAQQWACAA